MLCCICMINSFEVKQIEPLILWLDRTPWSVCTQADLQVVGFSSTEFSQRHGGGEDNCRIKTWRNYRQLKKNIWILIRSNFVFLIGLIKWGLEQCLFSILTFWAIGSVKDFQRATRDNQERQDVILLHADAPCSWKTDRGCQIERVQNCCSRAVLAG